MSFIASYTINMKLNRTLAGLKDAVRIAHAAGTGQLPLPGHDDYDHARLMGWVKVECRGGIGWDRVECDTIETRRDGCKGWNIDDGFCTLIKAGPVWAKVNDGVETFRVKVADIELVKVEHQVD